MHALGERLRFAVEEVGRDVAFSELRGERLGHGDATVEVAYLFGGTPALVTAMNAFRVP